MALLNSSTVDTSEVVRQLQAQMRAMAERVEELTETNDTLQETIQAQAQMAANGGMQGALAAPKFPKPEPYDGKGDVRPFLTHAKAYLRVNNTLSTSVSKILAIGSLLTGKAFEWWEPTLRNFLDFEPGLQDMETQHIFEDYNTFEDRLMSAFGNPDEVKTATRQLKALRQTGSAAHYARDIKRLFAKLNYNNGAKKDVFYDGLREDVKDDLYREDRPELFDDFVDLAIKCDNRLYERRMEKQGRGGRLLLSSGPPRANQGKRRGGSYRSTAYGHHAGPMDLDAASRDTKKKTGNCYNCGKPGHYSNKCRQPKKQWKPVPEKYGSVAERVTERQLCVFERSDTMNLEQTPEIPDAQPHTLNWLEQLDCTGTTRTIAQTPSVDDTTSEEEESEDEDGLINVVRGVGRDVTDPLALRDVILNTHDSRRESHGPPPGSQWALHPSAEGHDYISWFSCGYDSCQIHFWKKIEYRWFPRDNGNITLYLDTILDKWEVVCKIISHRTIVLKRPGIDVLDLPQAEMNLVHKAWAARGKELFQGETPELKGKPCAKAIYPRADVPDKWKSWSEESELATSVKPMKLQGTTLSGNDQRLK